MSDHRQIPSPFSCRRHRLAIAMLLVAGLVTIPVAGADEPSVARVQLLVDSGARVDWAPQGDRIAFDRRGSDGYTDVWIAAPDGAGERCLTCDIPDFAKRHAGDPVWHPSGQHLVMVVERPHKRAGEPQEFLAVPGANRGDDLWAISDDGKRFTQLTRRGEGGGRSRSPRFSFEGDRLAWTERVTGQGIWGNWVLRTGRFAVSRGLASVRGIRSPGGRSDGFAEVSTFTPDDNSVVLSSSRSTGQPERGLDLWSVPLAGDSAASLTDEPDRWDRDAVFSPDGTSIVFTSNRELRPAPRPDPANLALVTPTELWVMGSDGSTPRRLSRFNDPVSDQYIGRVTVSSPSWSRDGQSLIVAMAPVGSPGQNALYLVELEGP